MSKPTIKIIDLATGEEIERQMTQKEYDNYLANQEKEAAEKALRQQELATKEAARQSALEKLAALGLTEAEIQALAG